MFHLNLYKGLWFWYFFSLLHDVYGTSNLRDPITNEIIESNDKTMNLVFRNGQEIIFKSKQTYEEFQIQPKQSISGSWDDSNCTQEELKDKLEVHGLCPVCGMAVPSNGDPRVHFRHGNQAIHTCSLHHARMIENDPSSYEVKTETSTGIIQNIKNTDSTKSKPFCVGGGSVMLNGFSWRDEGTEECIILWFGFLTLHTKWMFYGGCLTVFFLAIFNEYLLGLRRTLREKACKSSSKTISTSMISYGSVNTSISNEETSLISSNINQRDRTTSECAYENWSNDYQHLAQCLLHGITLAIAYLLMLTAMTYSISLFSSTIAGFVVGHYIFGERKEAIPEFSDPSLSL